MYHSPQGLVITCSCKDWLSGMSCQTPQLAFCMSLEIVQPPTQLLGETTWQLFHTCINSLGLSLSLTEISYMSLSLVPTRICSPIQLMLRTDNPFQEGTVVSSKQWLTNNLPLYPPVIVVRSSLVIGLKSVSQSRTEPSREPVAKPSSLEFNVKTGPSTMEFRIRTDHIRPIDVFITYCMSALHCCNKTSTLPFVNITTESSWVCDAIWAKG